ncbi:MAG: hypothetical protein DDT19_00556 [Syntrophomonadaceae bacterium]|nr:hypothetical protein [Bacillota bacterium]
MTVFKASADVLSLFSYIDKSLDGLVTTRPDVYLLGGAAIILKHKGHRWTHDVDVISPSFDTDVKEAGIGTQFADKGLSVVAMSAILVHPKWRERTSNVTEYRNFSLKALSAVDIAISKTARGHEQDFYDLYNSDITLHFTLEDFNLLYREGIKSGWVKNDAVLENNRKRAEEVIIKRQLSTNNGHLFEERCKEIIGGIAHSAGVGLNFTLEDFDGSFKIPQEFLVFSFLLLSNKDKSFFKDKMPEEWRSILPSLTHFINNAGKSLSDTWDVLSFVSVLREHLRQSMWDVGKRLTENFQCPAEGIRTLKMLQTVASEFFSDFSPDVKKEIEGCFGVGKSPSL